MGQSSSTEHSDNDNYDTYIKKLAASSKFEIKMRQISREPTSVRAIYSCAKSKNRQQLKTLLQSDISINCTDENDHCAITLLAAEGDSASVKFLLKHCVYANANAALFAAAKSHHRTLVDSLIRDFQADPLKAISGAAEGGHLDYALELRSSLQRVFPSDTNLVITDDKYFQTIVYHIGCSGRKKFLDALINTQLPPLTTPISHRIYLDTLYVAMRGALASNHLDFFNYLVRQVPYPPKIGDSLQLYYLSPRYIFQTGHFHDLENNPEQALYFISSIDSFEIRRSLADITNILIRTINPDLLANMAGRINKFMRSSHLDFEAAKTRIIASKNIFDRHLVRQFNEAYLIRNMFAERTARMTEELVRKAYERLGYQTTSIVKPK